MRRNSSHSSLTKCKHQNISAPAQFAHTPYHAAVKAAEAREVAELAPATLADAEPHNIQWAARKKHPAIDKSAAAVAGIDAAAAAVAAAAMSASAEADCNAASPASLATAWPDEGARHTAAAIHRTIRSHPVAPSLNSHFSLP